MTRVPGAREELDRARDWLCGQVRGLVAEVSGDPGARVRVPEQPGIGAWEESGEALRFTYTMHEQDLATRAGIGDPAATARAWLEAAGWEVTRVVPERPPHPASVEAQSRGCRLRVSTRREPASAGVWAATPTVMLHEPRSENPAPPACPGCDRALRWVPLGNGRARRRPGGPRRLRPEVWWKCPGCGWAGFQQHEGEELVPMRYLTSQEGDGCYHCTEEGVLVATEPVRDEQGLLHDWVVCMSCGVSDGRRWDPDR